MTLPAILSTAESDRAKLVLGGILLAGIGVAHIVYLVRAWMTGIIRFPKYRLGPRQTYMRAVQPFHFWFCLLAFLIFDAILVCCGLMAVLGLKF